MPVRVFSEDEKTAIREKLLSVGFPMLKEYGLIHMSIPKIAKEAGIGTGTFYRFFASKEEYVYQVIVYQRNIFMNECIPSEVKSGKRKLSRDEVRSLVEMLVDKDKSVYANLSLSDEEKLFGSVQSFYPDVEKEKRVSGFLLELIDEPKESLNFPLLANLFKILAITSEARSELHAEAFEQTVSCIIDMILKEIYGLY